MRKLAQQKIPAMEKATPRVWPVAPAPMLGNQARLRQLSTPRIQAKLEVGAVDDPLEREADAVADRVMRMADPGTDVSTSPARVSRKCDECEKEDKQTLRPKRDGAQAGGAEAPASVHEALRTPGERLGAAMTAFMERRFARDFSDVRIHTDSEAAASAKSIAAQAYTIGRHVVFGPGRYSPGTAQGRRLLAHELAHVVQQGASSETTGTLRRGTDYDIRGIDRNSAAQPSKIFFDMGSVTIPASELPKIKAAATPPSRSLTLEGTSSEEGTAASNLAIIKSRIASVRMALQSAGHTGPEIEDPEPTAGEKHIDYRSVRAVEIIPAGGVSTTPPCQQVPGGPPPEERPCGSAFATAQPQALAKVTTALAALPDAASKPVIDSLFPGVALATISGRLSDLKTQLGLMAGAGGKVCHNTCDERCGRPGYNSGQGAAAVMTLCPDYDSGPPDFQITLLMHEGMHATPGPKVRDISYRSQRAFNFLTGAQAETNTDSYVSLILQLQPGAPNPLPGGPPTDTLTAMSPAEEGAARRALAFTEKWLEISEWDTSQLYGAIGRNVGHAGGWDGADDYHAATQHAIGWLLGLTDPGPVSPFANAPVKEDAVKVAGIHDRYDRMSRVVRRKSITINKGAADSWSAPGGPVSVSVSAPFFGKDPGDQVVFLITLLAGVVGDIPATMTDKYGHAANQIRWHKGGIGP